MRSAKLCLRLLLALWLVGVAAQAQTPEVKRAYDAIPHRYTPFNAGQARMAESDAAYLTRSFELVNQAVAARVQGLQSKGFARYDNQAATILASLSALKPPKSLSQYHALLIGAVEDQRAFFQEWSTAPGRRFEAGNPLVQSSSQKLRAAYGILMQKYPNQAKQVQDAFFDHLCALDFI